MTTPPITNPDQLTHVAALSAAADAAAATVQAARAADDNVRTRRRELTAMLATHDAEKLAADPDVSAELSALLA